MSKPKPTIVASLLFFLGLARAADPNIFGQSHSYYHMMPYKSNYLYEQNYLTDNYQSEFGETGRPQHHEPDYSYPDSTGQESSPNLHRDLDSFDISAQNSFSSATKTQSDKEYLTSQFAHRSCSLDRGSLRKDALNNTYLSYCSRYRLETLLSNEVLMSIMHRSSEQCEKLLTEFIQLDELINQFDRLFKNLLTRYNCHNGYSVKWSCEDCKKAYKDWLCATNLPFYMKGERVKPCISFCERVEQRCPYLHPITKEQYGGQPVFICRDPNIPFVPEITPDIPYSESMKCYDLCHLSDDLNELIIDSLSKYDYDKCPDENQIAEETRNESLPSRDSNHYQSDTDYPTEDPNLTTQVANSSSIDGRSSTTGLRAHVKKLNELREVLAIYKSQPKSHKIGHYSDHSSIDTHRDQLHHYI